MSASYLPLFRYYIDLDGDGDFDEAEEDITTYVISASWTIGMNEPYQTLADEARATLTLNNADRRFSPENPSSPLNTHPFKLLPEHKLRIAGGDTTIVDNDGEIVVDESGETLEMIIYQVVVGALGEEVQSTEDITVITESDTGDATFYTGYIELINPEPNRYGDNVATIEATSLKRRLQQGEILFPLLPIAITSKVIERVHERALPTLDHVYDDVDEGALVYQNVGHNLEEYTDGYTILNELAEAEQGWLWYNRDGQPAFRSAAHKQEKTEVDQVFSDIAAEPINVMPNANTWYGIGVSADAGCTATKVANINRYGNNYLRITTNTSLNVGGHFGRDTAGVVDDIPVTNGVTYTALCWMRGVENYEGVPFAFFVKNTVSATLYSSGNTFLTGDWQLFAGTFTISGGNNFLRLKAERENSATAVVFDVAGFMLVEGSVIPTHYNDGIINQYDEYPATMLEYEFGQDIRNKIQATYYIPEVDEELSTVWDRRRDLTLRPGETVTINAKFKSPDGQRLGAFNAIEPNSADGSMTFKKGSATALITEENIQHIQFTVTNDSLTKRCIINRMFVQAYLVTSWSPELVIVQDDDSVAQFGENLLDFDLMLVDEEHRALNIANHYLLQRSQPHGLVKSISIYNRDIYTHDMLINRLGIGSRVTVKEYQTETQGDYFIIGEQHEVQSTSHDYMVTYYLDPVPRYNGWLVGIPGRSEIGISTITGL
jgi:hypothetical protein